MKIVICDDDLNFLKLFYKMLYGEFVVRGILPDIKLYNDPNKLFASNCKEVDVFFLDIDMPNVSGIDLAKVLRSNSSSEFVFVSSHEEWIRLSMQVKPIAFIRKLHLETDIKDALDSLLEEISVKKRTVYLNDGKKGLNIELRSVLYFSSDKDYVLIHTHRNDHLSIRQKLDVVESKVSGFNFLRIHSRYLVNMHAVERFEQDYNKKQRNVILKNGVSLAVSDKYWQDVKSRLKNWFQYQTTK